MVVPIVDSFAEAVQRHDALLRARGFDIWAGSEPTFTDRHSNEPEWTTQALGKDKVQRAERLLRGFHREFPGGVVLRTIGRQYPGEEKPRWSLGLYRLRDGQAFWQGPDDPLLIEDPSGPAADLPRFAETLLASFAEIGARGWRFPGGGECEQRIVLRRGGADPPDWTDSRLHRPSVHCGEVPKTGLHDNLAMEGLWLFLLSSDHDNCSAAARIELPAFGDVNFFIRVLQAIGRAARQALVDSVVLCGFPPPVDRTVEWATITPDPAVVEINMAPDGSAVAFLERSRAAYRSAEALGLAPFRLYFNGAVADSGGGGQITLGGPSAGTSPFFVQPRLLPRLIRYFNRHPSLSFLFAHDSIGGSGQSVRPDERGNDAFRELCLALELLDRNESPTPEILWRSLAPFLTDPSGNSHRAELNIEKLWNPFLPSRGQLGLVEFRAFRMQHSPERASALICLLRAVAAMLMASDFYAALTDWGLALHERYALPFYLEQDLRDVLADLNDSGFALTPPIPDVLLRDESRDLVAFDLTGCFVRLRRGLEFWPLVGDTSSQEQGTSRLVDASTQRLELTLRPQPGWEDRFGQCRVWAEGIELPLRDEGDERHPVKVFGLRYRSFVPWQGLHPTLPPSSPIHLVVQQVAGGELQEMVWHEWRPAGGPYPGQPQDLQDASERRRERLALRTLPGRALPSGRNVLPGSVTPWSLDLRWLIKPASAEDR